MSNAFRVKNRLNLTPQATEPTGLELGDLWMDAEGTLKRWDGTASQDVGSGGVGSVDIMFADTFDATNISEYTTTGTVAVTDNVLEVIQGKKSLKITHTGGASAERIIPVDIKFRNKNVTFSFDVESDALSGNLTLTVTDNTNTVTLINAESIQPQGTLDTSVKRSVSFTIPDDCEELKYKFTAVSESGKISIIDNVVIELTQTAKLSTTIEVPVVTEWVDAGPITITATTTNPTKATTRQQDSVRWRQVGEDYEVEYRYRADSSAGAAAGSGGYLFSLPTGIEFADDQPLGTISTTLGAALTADVANVTRNSSKIGYGTLAENNAGHTFNSMVVYAVSGNRFQALGLNSLSTGFIINSGYYSLAANNTVYNFTLKFKGKNLQATLPQEVSLAQAVLKQESDSFVNASGTTGYGSTRTRIRRFTNVRSMGTAITYVDSPTNGAEFIVNEAGLYDLSFTEQSSSGTPVHSITVNQVNFPTPTASEIVAAATISTGTGTTTASVGGYYLNVGDIVRCDSSLTITSNLQTEFNISKSGSLKQVNVTENQKIEIPTSELRMEGASTRGTGSDAAIVRFDNIAKLRGDAFTIESTAALGTVITMKKKGKLDINLSLSMPTSSSRSQITLNQSIRTLTSGISSEILADSHSSSASNLPPSGMTASLFVNIGDVIRVASTVTPAVAAGNNLNLSFQEQEIAVSVTNVLPQFSESDSSVRVDTANGYGSPTGTRIRRFSNVRDNLGSAITYVPSATDGDSFVINEDSVYNIHYNESVIGNSYFGITKNASSLSTNIISTPMSQRLAMEFTDNSTGSYNVGWNGYLQKGDIIRAHTDGGAASSGQISFAISKVGKPNVTGVDVTPFAKIEYEVTQYVEIIQTGQQNTPLNVTGSLTLDTSTGLLSYNSTTGFFTALKTCRVNLNYSTTLNATATIPSIIVNGVTKSQDAGGSFANASWDGVLNKDDTFYFRDNASGSNNSRKVYVSATELRDAYQVIGGGVENTYSAVITSAAAITSQSYPFIASVTKGGTGIYNVNFVSGFVTSAPFCSAAFGQVATGVISNSGVIQATDITTSGCIVRTFNTSFSPLDLPFTLKVERQGSDYRTPSKAIGLPQQRVAIITDRKANNVAAQVISTTYIAKHINTLIDPTGLIQNPASFTGTGGTNTSVVLNAGTYKISAMGQINSGAGNVFSKIRLYNATDASVIQLGSSAYSAGSSGDDSSAPSFVEAYFTLTAQKTLELQHRINSGSKNAGQTTNFGEDELYTTMVIEKVEE